MILVKKNSNYENELNSIIQDNELEEDYLEDNNNKLACIEFGRIKGGKQFNPKTDWFQSMLKEIGQ